MSMPHTCRCSICHREMQDFTAISTITSQASRIATLEAELARVQQSHDYWDKKHDGLTARIAQLEAALRRLLDDLGDGRVMSEALAAAREALGEKP